MSKTIRIAHISDTHLGFRALHKADPVSGRNQRTVDMEHALERAITDILARDVDGIIHGGDVFHHARPTWQSLRHFIQQMRRIERAGIPTLVIGGNHDTPRIRTGGSAYSVLDLALPEIRFVAEYEDVHEFDTFKDLNLHVQAIPHGALTNDDPVIPRIREGMRNVLVCHGMVRGILAPGIHAEPGEIELTTSLLDPAFDYIALGHYHLHMLAAPKAWYSGSTERTGWGDREVTPGYCIVELGDPGDEPKVEHIDLPARPMIDLKPVYGDGLRGRDIADKVLAQLEKVADPGAMARVAIRNSERPDKREAESILRREAEAFVWSLTVANERSVPTQEDDAAQRTEEFPDLRTLFARFVEGRRTDPRHAETYTDTFAAAFLERGDRALADAMLAQDAPKPEEDPVA